MDIAIHEGAITRYRVWIITQVLLGRDSKNFIVVVFVPRPIRRVVFYFRRIKAIYFRIFKTALELPGSSFLFGQLR